MPGDPGFEQLSVPSARGANVGRTMNSEAIRRLILAHGAGWSYHNLAALYERFKTQIERAARGWRANKADCVDGSYAFIGSQGRVLVIMPDRSIHIGVLGATQADGLLYYIGTATLPDGTLAFPRPNPGAPGTKKVC